MRGRAVVAYQAHNLKVIGSIPVPATNYIFSRPTWAAFLLPVFMTDNRLIIRYALWRTI